MGRYVLPASFFFYSYRSKTAPTRLLEMLIAPFTEAAELCDYSRHVWERVYSIGLLLNWGGGGMFQIPRNVQVPRTFYLDAVTCPEGPRVE